MMGVVTINLTPLTSVTAGGLCIGCLVLDRDPLSPLPRDSHGALRFPDQPQYLVLKVASRLVQDRLGDRLQGPEDRGLVSQHALKG